MIMATLAILMGGAWHLELIFLYAALCFLYVLVYQRTGQRIPGLQMAYFLSLGLILIFLLGEATAESISATLILGLVIWSAPLLYYFIQHHRSLVIHLLVLGLVIHSLWGVAQFSLQSDLNLHLLGETRIDIGQPGIATITDLAGTKIVRAYGPYSHPNVLAGNLILGLIVLTYYLKNANRQHASFYLIVWYWIFLALLLSFSRAAWLAAAILAVVSCWTPTKNVRAILVFITIIIFTPLVLTRSPNFNEAAVTDRLNGTSQALTILQELPVWHGVGPGNYEHTLKNYLDENGVPYEPWQITPVHNVPLLLAVEWGILPVVLTIAWLLYRYAPRFRTTWPYLLPLIPLLFFDHYLRTQPASLMSLLLVLIVLAQLPTSRSASAAPPSVSPTQQSPR